MSQQEGHFRFSPRLLDHLGVSAYNSVPKCLGELVANAYDADATEVRIELPEKIEPDAAVVVSDNGTGMTPADVLDKFLFIGRNKREDGQRTPGKRLKIGSKGLGKLAGFGIASEMALSTRQGAEQTTLLVSRQLFQNVDSLASIAIPLSVQSTSQSHGTTITLHKLNPGLKPLSPDKLRQQLFRASPKVVDFRVYVNGIECTADDVAGDRTNFDLNIASLGRVHGFYIVAQSRQDKPGLSVRVRGRLVKEPTLFGLDTRSHGFFTASKICGEINAEFLDPEDGAVESTDLINTSRDGFLEDSPIVDDFYRWARAFVEEIVEGVDTKETEKRADVLLGNPDIKRRLDALPAHVRGNASQVVRQILTKLRNVENEDVGELVEWLLRYYESNVMRELMRAIIAADSSETEKLASLIQDWGLKQLNSITESINAQIQIIDKLEELTASDKTWEVELHKLVEKNLWLIREGLEVWSSNKPLKSVLDAKIDEIYREKQDLRPDLICRSRNGSSAIIIEFKRPKEVITMAHVTQALEYTGLIKEHSPAMTLTTYVIGRQYDPSVVASRENLEKASIYLWSFTDVLHRARSRFEKILDILGR